MCIAATLQSSLSALGTSQRFFSNALRSESRLTTCPYWDESCKGEEIVILNNQHIYQSTQNSKMISFDKLLLSIIGAG